MNILTFDIEDWYNCDFISNDLNWDKHEVRIYQGVDRILKELSKRNLKATFFCLGWIAEHHPEVLRSIHREGHHIGCHSYQHQLSTNFSKNQFKDDVKKAKELIEDVISESINTFRAPGFSITESNPWAFEILAELGFLYDCSIFPAAHDYGGFKSYGIPGPSILSLSNGLTIKEFPINFQTIFGKDVVFSGGGFFRLFPYPLIKKWSAESQYLMTYFHPRDFDPEQPVIESLPAIRRFKSYYGLKGSFSKFQKYMTDFDFINIEQANKLIDWSNCKTIKIS